MVTTGVTAIGSIVSGIFGLLYIIFWIWMLVDCLTNSRLKGVDKIVWVLVIIFIQCLGSILYFLIGRKR